jgi:trimeric autotransporter adhesin
VEPLGQRATECTVKATAQKRSGRTGRTNTFALIAVVSLAVAILVVTPARADGAVRYVNTWATGANNGTSWHNAYTHLQDALAAAASGDQVWAAAGNYAPTDTADRGQSFLVPDGVQVYGGFNGTEATLTQRDWATNRTFLNGDIGFWGDASDNSYCVVQFFGAGDHTVLDGFTVTGGNAGGMSDGGGMQILNASPTLANLVFTGNSAPHGGAIYMSDSGPALTNILFHRNWADSSGGAIFNSGSSPLLQSVTFAANYSHERGAAIRNELESSCTLVNCILWSDYNEGTDVEIYNDAKSSCDASYCLVQGGYPGVGNLDRDPQFKDASSADYHLTDGSPAIDTGIDRGAPGEVDLDGQVRPADGDLDATATPDMGAFEYHGPASMYVDFWATGANNGTSWHNAYTHLQNALDLATPGDEIWVAAGEYAPTTNTDRSRAFVLSDEVRVYGGFNGTEVALSQRNWVTNPTILSGDIGVPGDSSDNSYRVLVGSGASMGTVLDGFTIMNGFNQAGTGAGMVIVSGEPKLANLIFTGNLAALGGALYLEDSYPTLTNVLFHHNSALSEGGAVYEHGSSPFFVNVTFAHNTATNCGGAILDASSHPVLFNCILWGNDSDDGWQIYDDGASGCDAIHCLVQYGWPGTGNLAVDPQFRDASSTDYRLTSGSPAIDAGGGAWASAFDLDGRCRPVDGNGDGTTLPDMGAYEYPAPVTVRTGWNLVAGAPGTNFGGGIFGWNGSSYVSTLAPVAWLGYWRKATAGSVVSLVAVAGPHTTSLSTGWNLIGNPMGCRAALTLPSGRVAFIYDPVGGTYVSTTTLASGQGAWVKGTAGESVLFTALIP